MGTCGFLGVHVKSVSPKNTILSVMQNFSHILHVLLCRCFSLFIPLRERDLYFVNKVLN